MRISGSACSPTKPAVSSEPATNSSASTSGSKPCAVSNAAASSSARVTLVRPSVEPSCAGFTISGSPSRAATPAQSLSALQHLPARRRQAAGHPHHLGAHLVHRERRGHHAAAGVGDAHQLQRTLHRPVLAVAPVQRDEDALEALALQLEHLALRRIEGVRVHAGGLQRLEDVLPRHQRDLPLGRFAAHEDCHFAEVLHSVLLADRRGAKTQRNAE